MTVTRLTTWVRGNMGTTAKYAIAVVVTAFSLGGYVAMAAAQDAQQDHRLDQVERKQTHQDEALERIERNNWLICIALRPQLGELGEQCERPQSAR